MSHLYALLTGINHYHPQSDSVVTSLQGCKNDIEHLKTFLENHIPGTKRDIVTLVDSDATYQNVINHFGDEFLLRAKAEDTVLFAYAGHGSREKTAPEFLKYYPDGMEETLVLYDSRISGGLDLADKEIAVLIERIAAKGAHVVVLLDSCHSGSATRDIGEFTFGSIRQISSRLDQRNLDSYLKGEYLKRTNFYLPNSRHISLAACEKTEKAFELKEKRGLFSSKLLQILEKTNGQVSYADLYAQCRMAISQITKQQHPQFDTHGFFNAYDCFLKLGSDSLGKPLNIFFRNNLWQASMGAVHGLPVSPGNTATFEVKRGNQVLGQLNTRMVGMESSSLESPRFPLNPDEIYEARLTSLVQPRKTYLIKGDLTKVAEAKLALQSFKPLYFDLQQGLLTADYCLEVTQGQIQLFRQADSLCLRIIEGNDWTKMYVDAFQKLEQIARWEKTVDLDNQDNKINRNTVELVLVEMDERGIVQRKTSDNEIVIDILCVDKKEQEISFRLEIKNKHDVKPRYCALFYADDHYGFHALGFNDEILPQKTVIALDKNPDGIQYSFKLNGKNETIDIFKLFVSNSKINEESFPQNGFKIGATVDYWVTRSETTKSGITPQVRAIGGFIEDTDKENENDWYTLTLKVKSVARQANVGEHAISLANDFIKILPHQSFRSGVALRAVNSKTRDIEPMSVIPELTKNNEVELLIFNEGSRSLSPVNMIEFFDISNEDSLLDQPLQIEIATNLKEINCLEDFLLPLTFDGEHLIPVGEVHRLSNGKALVNITHLPNTVDRRRRSLGKALKLCFLKLALQKNDLQRLCWVDYSNDTVNRCTDDLPIKVSRAKNILLVIHGIIGDSKGMAECMRQAFNDKLYDLVLTYDYENLNTKIEITASQLADRLKEVGITQETDKKITILAHSMGGLVSRYFIENLQGNKIVKHLIMAGTPNQGSAIATVTAYRDFMMPLLTLLINSAWGIPAAASILAIMKHSKLVTPTLEQMNKDHPDGFLKNLNKSADPGIIYSMVAGNLEEYLSRNAEQKLLINKLLELGGKLFYQDQPNDLAVSIESIKGIPNDRQPAPLTVEVPGNHLNYFYEEQCVVALMEIIRKNNQSMIV